MSAIGGICNLDGAPVDRAVLVELSRGLSSRGPDGGGEYSADSIGMVYRAFHTNRESRLERQPLVVANSHVLCWDGRLDNRDELIDLLRPLLCGERTDAAIVSAAYEEWELEFLGRIIGDFALSLWDIKSKTLILARDVIGSRDLYYQLTGETLIWSTELEVLLDQSIVDLDINDDYMAGYLTRLPEPSQTPYKGIDAVPPACAVIVRERKVETKRFWGLDPTREIHYQTDAEYEEHFRHLFREAVQCRLRGDAPVFSELSGGLDSSSIACMATQLINDGRAEAPVLTTVSATRDESASSNELRFITYVEQKIGRKGRHLPESTFRILNRAPLGSSSMPNPLECFAEYHKGVVSLMKETNSRVLLSGQGGDEILNSSPNPSSELADILASANVLQLHRSLRVWSRDRKTPYTKLLWQKAILPSLPKQIRSRLKQGPIIHLRNWLNPEFVERMHLRERMLGPADVFGFQTPSGRDQSVSFLCAVRDLAAGYRRALNKSDITFPFMHRPLIEFMQAIPQQQRVRPGETRSLQRRALRDLLPAETVKRKGKGIPDEAILRAIIREHRWLRSVFVDSHAARLGYINKQALLGALDNARYGDCQSVELVQAVPLEFWLRSLQRRRSWTKINAA
ncbi:MAG TPA: asparagine synthase-related protein [Pyrinomonadaceae bacterium]|nr:asparagine synthase-related protein [Pyrinomonadaceae bacterium]